MSCEYCDGAKDTKLEISDRIKQKMAFVFMIIQVKAIDTTSGVTAMGASQ